MEVQKNKKLTDIFPPFLKKIADMLYFGEKSIEGMNELIAKSQKTANSVISGLHKKKKAGIGENFWQYREYNIHDRPQDIDWRYSARSDNVYIKQKELQSTQNIYFWCDMSPSMKFSSKGEMRKDERAAIFALSLSLLLTNSGEMVALLGEDIKAGRTREKIEKMAQILYDKIKSNDFTDIHSLNNFKVPANSTLVLISDFFDDIGKLSDEFKALSRIYKSCFVIQIIDEAEIEFPFKGRVMFHNPEGVEIEKVERAEEIKEEYQKRIRKHCSDLENLCKNLRWDYYLYDGKKDIKKCLSEIYKIWSLKTK